MENLTKHCNDFTSTARQLAVKLDAPMVNDLGFSKRYVRCLQISEVVNSMKDLISFEKKTGLGPIESLAGFPSARKLQQEGLLSNLPAQPSLTQMINHLTQGSPHPSQVSYVHQSGHLPHVQPNMQQTPSGQQSAPSVQGNLLNQLQPPALPQVHREPSMAKLAQFSNLRGQMEARNYGMVQPGQAFNSNQMQPPASPHFARNTSANQLQLQLDAQAISQLQGHASPGVISGNTLSASPSPLSGNQMHLQRNHVQVLSQLQGQTGLSQISPPMQSGGQLSPNFNQLSQQAFHQTHAKQSVSQPSAQVHLQSHSLNQAGTGGQQSLPGTPQSEMSDLRSNT